MKKVKTIIISFSTAALIFASTCSAFVVGAVGYSGSGTIKDPYLVTNAEQLQSMRENLSAHYKLANTIDLKGVDFKPIGRLDGPFTGSFVCELNADKTPKYAIKNLTVTVAETGYTAELKNKWEAALFGATDGANISGIYIFDINITNNVLGDNTGAVVYGNYKPGMDDMNSAGLIGQADNTSVSNCATTGVIGGRASGAGGLIGRINNSTVDSCYSTVTVTTEGKWQIGGFAGNSKNSNVSYCFSTGSVKGGQATIGGFIGSLSGGSISDCYATGNASGVSEGDGIYSFGLWQNDSDAKGITLTNCYALGTGGPGTSTGVAIPTTASAVLSNCWGLSGVNNGMKCFSGGDIATIKNAFSGLSNWDVSGSYPQITSIGIVTDSAKYQPGAVNTAITGTAAEGAASSGSTVTASGDTAQSVSVEELAAMINALPDPDEENSISLKNKEDIMAAWNAYEGLSASQKDDFDSALYTKLTKARDKVSVLVAADVVKRIKALPDVEKLTPDDVEEILSIWDDYNFLSDDIKSELDDEIVEKLNAAYKYATGENTDTGTAIDNGLTTLEWVIVIVSGVVIVLSISFDVFAGIYQIKHTRKKAEAEDTAEEEEIVENP